MIETKDLPSYISGYDEYCEPRNKPKEDDRDFYEDYLLEKEKQMKYTIEGFNQSEVLKLGSLDVVDLIILRWIVDFEPNMTKKIIDDEIYFWVNYQSLLDALPILNMCKKTLYRRLDKMCDVEILKHKNIKDKGNFSYYAFGKKYFSLVSQMSQPCVANVPTLRTQMSQPLGHECPNKDSSIKEINPLKDSIPPYNPPEDDKDTLFKKFWMAYPKKVSKGNAEKWFKKNQPSENLVKKMISKLNLLKKSEQWTKSNGKFIPHPASWLNAKGWEDELEINRCESSTSNWLGKEIEADPMTEEELREFEKMLEGNTND